MTETPLNTAIEGSEIVDSQPSAINESTAENHERLLWISGMSAVDEGSWSKLPDILKGMEPHRIVEFFLQTLPQAKDWVAIQLFLDAYDSILGSLTVESQDPINRAFVRQSLEVAPWMACIIVNKHSDDTELRNFARDKISEVLQSKGASSLQIPPKTSEKRHDTVTLFRDLFEGDSRRDVVMQTICA